MKHFIQIVGGRDERGQHKHHEHAMVLEAHALVYEQTVVVKLLATALAQFAVLGWHRLHDQARFAKVGLTGQAVVVRRLGEPAYRVLGGFQLGIEVDLHQITQIVCAAVGFFKIFFSEAYML